MSEIVKFLVETKEASEALYAIEQNMDSYTTEESMTEAIQEAISLIRIHY